MCAWNSKEKGFSILKTKHTTHLQIQLSNAGGRSYDAGENNKLNEGKEEEDETKLHFLLSRGNFQAQYSTTCSHFHYQCSSSSFCGL
jgi:hypothetical protein